MYGFYSLEDLIKLTQNLLHILDTTPRVQVLPPFLNKFCIDV